MGLIIEFLAEFDKAIIVSKEYETLEELLVKPIAVSKGEVVGRIIESGKVYAHDLGGVMCRVAEGQEIDKLVGDNLSLSNGDPQEIISSIDGCVSVIGGVLKVARVMELFGDVDRRTGNIMSKTSIKIHGGVAHGFEVVSSGDVEIEGLVEGARVEALGKVTFKSGVVGADEGVTVARGDIYAKFAQACKLESQGSITIDGPAMNCELVAARKVTLQGKSSALVGGVTRAREEVSVSKVGSQGALPTQVYVGYDPFAIKRKGDRQGKLNALGKLREDKIKETNFVMESLKDVVSIDSGDILSAVFHLSDIVRSKGADKFNKEQNRALKNLAGDILSVIGVDGDLKKVENEEKEDVLGTPFAKAQIKVSDIAHPGVKISILEDELTLDREYERVRFVIDDGKIKSVGI